MSEVTVVTSWLKKAGAFVAHAASVALSKVLPAAAAVAQQVEPLVDLVLPAEGDIYNTVVAAVIATEQAYAANGTASGTGAQKLAAVLKSVEGVLLPRLAAAGITGAAATATITGYINAIVSILNGPSVTSA